MGEVLCRWRSLVEPRFYAAEASEPCNIRSLPICWNEPTSIAHIRTICSERCILATSSFIILAIPKLCGIVWKGTKGYMGRGGPARFLETLDFYRTQVSLVRSMGLVVSNTPFADLTDVTLADEDTKLCKL